MAHGVLWPNGWMDEYAACYTEGSRPRPRPPCTRRGPSSRERGTAASPCLLWPRSPISSTVELLFRYASGRTDRPTHRHWDTLVAMLQCLNPPRRGEIIWLCLC